MQASLDDWNELRLILAVARAGALSGAAKTLGIDHSTVYRRLQSIEGKLGIPLFDRVAGGVYVPTGTGERLAAAGERMEDEALALARDLAGRDRRLEGRLRVTSSETLAYRLLTRHITAFRAAYPGVTVELAIDNRVLSLSRREADVALRPMRPKEGDLWGRKLAEVAWTVYGSDEYFTTRALPAAPAALAAHALIGWEEGASGIKAADWLSAIVPSSSIVYRTSSLVNQLVAARAGMGLAVLPCYLGDPEPQLRRALAKPVPDLSRELWIATHTDLKATARVRAFFEVVGEGIAADKALIEGTAG